MPRAEKLLDDGIGRSSSLVDLFEDLNDVTDQ
jgi:hypothetical protein